MRRPARSPRSWRMCGHGWRGRSAISTLARQVIFRLLTLSPDWEAAFSDSMVGPPEERQLAMAPGKLQEFVRG